MENSVPVKMPEPEDTANLKAQLEVISKETAFLKKYFALRKRCEQLQQSNEKMVNRIQHVKKLIKRYKRDKRYLTTRLDELGDNFRDVQVPLLWEEDQLYGSIRSAGIFKGTGSDSETEGRSRLECKSALSSIQPLLQAHGLGNLDAKTRKATPGFSGNSKPLRRLTAQQAMDMLNNLDIDGDNGLDLELSHDCFHIKYECKKKINLKLEKEKDPNAPKKPANAFLMFCTTQRTSVQEEYFKEHNEEIAHHELTKSLAQQWNALVPEEKRIYYEMYEREKERYEREMRSYKPKTEPGADASTSATSEPNTATGESLITSIKEELDV